MRFLAAGWELSSRALSGSSQALGRLLAVFLVRQELVDGWDSSSSLSTASQMQTPGTSLCFLITLSSTKSCMRLGVGSSLNFWFASVRRALSANSCGFLVRVRRTSRCTQVMNRPPAALRRSSRSGSPVMVFIRVTTSSRVAGSLLLLSLFSRRESCALSGRKCIKMLSTKSASRMPGSALRR